MSCSSVLNITVTDVSCSHPQTSAHWNQSYYLSEPYLVMFQPNTGLLQVWGWSVKKQKSCIPFAAINEAFQFHLIASLNANSTAVMALDVTRHTAVNCDTAGFSSSRGLAQFEPGLSHQPAFPYGAIPLCCHPVSPIEAVGHSLCSLFCRF